MRRKAALQEEIETLQHQLDALKAKRKEMPRATSGSMSFPNRRVFASSAPSPNSWSIPSK